MKGPDMTDTPVVLEAELRKAWEQLEAVRAMPNDRTKTGLGSAYAHVAQLLMLNVPTILEALSRPPVAGDGGEALEHLTNVLFADPGPKLAAAHKAARLWWNAQDGLEAPPPPTPEPSEVTGEVIQADRDAAADLHTADCCAPLSPYDRRIDQDYRAGKHDDWNDVLAFARHRLKFSTARRDEVFRQIAEQKLWSEMTANEQADGDFVGAYDEIVTRVRAALGEH